MGEYREFRLDFWRFVGLVPIQNPLVLANILRTRKLRSKPLATWSRAELQRSSNSGKLKFMSVYKTSFQLPVVSGFTWKNRLQRNDDVFKKFL